MESPSENRDAHPREPVAADASPAAIDPDDYRPCHGCGALVRLAAVKCRFCGQELAAGPPLPELVKRVAAKIQEAEELEKEGEFPHAEAKRHGKKLSSSTRVLLSLALAMTVGFGLEFLLPDRTPQMMAMVVTSIAAVIVLILAILRPYWWSWPLAFLFFCFPAAMYVAVKESRPVRSDGPAWVLLAFVMAFFAAALFFFLREDLWLPADARRSDPRRAFLAFFNSLRFKRWRYAYACILPGNKRLAHGRRERLAHKVRAGLFSIATVAGFKLYWKPLLNSEWGASRTVKLREAVVDRFDEKTAIGVLRYECKTVANIPFGIFGTLVLLFFSCVFPPLLLVLLGVVIWSSIKQAKGRELFTLAKYLHKVGEKWYIVSAEIESGEDWLPKLYHGEMERLYKGELPRPEVLAAAAMVSAARLDDATGEQADG